MWLNHVGLAQPLEAIEGDPDDRRRRPAGARDRRLLAARRAAPLARLLRRPGGRGAGRAGRPLRPRQRHPRPRRAHRRPRSACPSRSAAPRRSPTSTPASAARLTLSYGLALDAEPMRPVNLIPERGASRRAQRRCAAARSPTSWSAPWSRRCSGSRCWSSPNNQISDRKAEVADLEARKRRRRSPSRQARRLHPVPRRPRPAGRHGDQPRRQPLRLGTGDARTLAGPPQRRLADQPDRDRQRPTSRSTAAPASPCASSVPGPGAGNGRLRDRPGRRRRLRLRR